MKIIFLDVDGVLNTIGNVLDRIENPNRDIENGSTLNLNALENLFNIVMETDAFIVITSEWRRVPRLMNELMKSLSIYNLSDRVIGKTERIIVEKGSATHVDRGLEIDDYLNKHDCESYVILDDISWDLERFGEKLILTDPKYGITNKDALEAIRLLNEKEHILNK